MGVEAGTVSGTRFRLPMLMEAASPIYLEAQSTCCLICKCTFQPDLGSFKVVLTRQATLNILTPTPTMPLYLSC